MRHPRRFLQERFGRRSSAAPSRGFWRSRGLPPEAYRLPPDLLGLAASEVTLVAAHPGDLAAAAREGLKTGYVLWPLEWGPGKKPHDIAGQRFDIVADDFSQLAERLGA